MTNRAKDRRALPQDPDPDPASDPETSAIQIPDSPVGAPIVLPDECCAKCACYYIPTIDEVIAQSGPGVPREELEKMLEGIRASRKGLCRNGPPNTPIRVQQQQNIVVTGNQNAQMMQQGVAWVTPTVDDYWWCAQFKAKLPATAAE